MSTMLRILLVLGWTTGIMTTHAQQKLLTDFREPNVQSSWITVNDNVMGGKSKGGPIFTGTLLKFSGATNTDGGGFSSIRSKPSDWGLGKFDGLVMRVRGSKRTFQFDLGTDGRISRRRVAFRAEFVPTSDWNEVRIPFSDFKPSFFGRILTGSEAPALDQAQIATLGFFIYDKVDGPFQLEVDWIKAYRKAKVKAVSASAPVSPEMDEIRYLGFLSGRFGIRALDTSMVTNLSLLADKAGRPFLGDSPETKVITEGFDSLGRLEYLRLYHPDEYNTKLALIDLALRCTQGELDLTSVFATDENSALAQALTVALWAKVDRVSPGTIRNIVAGIKSGSRNGLEKIRSYVLTRASIDIGGTITSDVALEYLSATFVRSRD